MDVSQGDTSLSLQLVQVKEKDDSVFFLWLQPIFLNAVYLESLELLFG